MDHLFCTIETDFSSVDKRGRRDRCKQLQVLVMVQTTCGWPRPLCSDWAYCRTRGSSHNFGIWWLGPAERRCCWQCGGFLGMLCCAAYCVPCSHKGPEVFEDAFLLNTLTWEWSSDPNPSLEINGERTRAMGYERRRAPAGSTKESGSGIASDNKLIQGAGRRVGHSAVALMVCDKYMNSAIS